MKIHLLLLRGGAARKGVTMPTSAKPFINRVLRIYLTLLCCLIGAWGQTTSTGGSLNVSVLDPSGASVPNVSLELRDLSTNDVRRGATQANGDRKSTRLNSSHANI